MKLAAIAVALLSLVGLVFLPGCSRSSAPTVDRSGTARALPPPVSAEAASGQATQPESWAVSSESGPVGTWGILYQTIELNADGTGTMRAAGVGPEPVQHLAWTRDGDSIVVRRGGQPDLTWRIEGGKYLVLSSAGGGPTPMRAIRLTEDQSRAIAAVPGPPAEDTATARATAQQSTCLSNLKHLSLAMLMYAQDYDERYPAQRQDWSKATEPYFKNRNTLQCPADPNLPSYAINGTLLGHKLGDVPSPAELVLQFESDDLKTVAYRHNDGANYSFADGHCKWLRRGGEKAGATWGSPVWSLDRPSVGGRREGGSR
jgi:prepilin-type processing-associated H-X9-DG protein